MTTRRRLGYVVVEFNQASGQPSIDGFFSDDREDIEDVIKENLEHNAKTGRKERYAVGTVTIEDEDDD